MKRIITCFVSAILLVAVCMSLYSCKSYPIPEGRYSYESEFSLLGEVAYNAVENTLLKECMTNDEPEWVIYEAYDYQLNEEKNEITLTFTGYKYSGSDWCVPTVSNLNTQYESGEFTEIMPPKGPQTYPFSQGNGYFIINNIRYDKK